MPTRKADLEKERLRTKKPAAGYAVQYPPELPPEVVSTDLKQKQERRHPALRGKIREENKE